jgi:hypothetical protein
MRRSEIAKRLIVLLAILHTQAPSYAVAKDESLSTCNELINSPAAFGKCIVEQFKRNTIPGAGAAPGMTMDEMKTQIDRELCSRETGLCMNRNPGDTVGDCRC